ncbi:hypothetical protein BY458DRAFT_436125 [Sporodiniella umbellata]|nr:hypothetical protein BY458DRAFT_436125 [Sporodiniella umbellata]
MGKSRPRYNEKARASSKNPNQRPHPKARDGGLKTVLDQQQQESLEKNEIMQVKT